MCRKGKDKKKKESKYDKEKANTDRRVLLREESEEGWEMFLEIERCFVYMGNGSEQMCFIMESMERFW